jgi:ABC-type transport system substrate-binding protein
MIKSQPIGTGPFVLAEYVPTKRAVSERRPDYAWAPDFLHHTVPAKDLTPKHLRAELAHFSAI